MLSSRMLSQSIHIATVDFIVERWSDRSTPVPLRCYHGIFLQLSWRFYRGVCAHVVTEPFSSEKETRLYFNGQQRIIDSFHKHSVLFGCLGRYR